MPPRTHRATIYDLSREILANIFTHVARLDPKWAHLRPEKSEGPFALSAVCSEWRAVATATPELWDHFQFNFVLPNLERYPTRLKLWLAQTWLRNAKGRPLVLDLFYRTPWDADERKIDISVIPLKEVLEEFAAQISVLAVQCGSSGVLGFFGQVATGYPLLEELYLHPSADFDVFTVPPSVQPLFPRLTRLSLSRIALDGRDNLQRIDPKLSAVNWSKLTHLRLDRIAEKLPDICILLEHTPALIVCHIICISCDLSKVPAYNRTVLENLETFTLELSSGPAFVKFFQRFEFPALHQLSFGLSRGSNWPTMHEPAMQVCRAYASCLTGLSLSFECTTKVLADIVKSTREQLTELRIFYTSEIIEALGAKTLRLPRTLETLWIRLTALQAIAKVYGLKAPSRIRRDYEVFVLLDTYAKAEKSMTVRDCERLAREEGLRMHTGKMATDRPMWVGLHPMPFEAGFVSSTSYIKPEL
ncbi:F-box domain-containing protein [Mycena kentingensis (nom. inval.)]|nr:F-box domain-containing protein [Mycena kentingensis (nom. inval.)]